MRSLKNKLVSNYYYGVVVYGFTHPNKWNIQSLLKGICKDSHYIYIYIYKGLKKIICKVFINLKDNENQLLITKIMLLFNENTQKKNYHTQCAGLQLVYI